MVKNSCSPGSSQPLEPGLPSHLLKATFCSGSLLPSPITLCLPFRKFCLLSPWIRCLDDLVFRVFRVRLWQGTPGHQVVQGSEQGILAAGMLKWQRSGWDLLLCPRKSCRLLRFLYYEVTFWYVLTLVFRNYLGPNLMVGITVIPSNSFIVLNETVKTGYREWT